MSIGTCRRPNCSKPILWLAHETTGKTAPIDAEPVWGGNIEVIPDTATGEIVAYRLVPKDKRERRPYHLNHWASCEDPPPKKKPGFVVPKRRSDP